VGQIAIAIENALAFQEVSSLAARLQLLLNVTNRITSNLELRELLRAISTNIRAVMRCDMVAITLPDGPSGNGNTFRAGAALELSLRMTEARATSYCDLTTQPSSGGRRKRGSRNVFAAVTMEAGPASVQSASIVE
jgi:GAF domain-containing protein